MQRRARRGAARRVARRIRPGARGILRGGLQRGPPRCVGRARLGERARRARRGRARAVAARAGADALAGGRRVDRVRRAVARSPSHRRHAVESGGRRRRRHCLRDRAGRSPLPGDERRRVARRAARGAACAGAASGARGRAAARAVRSRRARQAARRPRLPAGVRAARLGRRGGRLGAEAGRRLRDARRRGARRPGADAAAHRALSRERRVDRPQPGRFGERRACAARARPGGPRAVLRAGRRDRCGADAARDRSRPAAPRPHRRRGVLRDGVRREPRDRERAGAPVRRDSGRQGARQPHLLRGARARAARFSLLLLVGAVVLVLGRGAARRVRGGDDGGRRDRALDRARRRVSGRHDPLGVLGNVGRGFRARLAASRRAVRRRGVRVLRAVRRPVHARQSAARGRLHAGVAGGRASDAGAAGRNRDARRAGAARAAGAASRRAGRRGGVRGRAARRRGRRIGGYRRMARAAHVRDAAPDARRPAARARVPCALVGRDAADLRGARLVAHRRRRAARDRRARCGRARLARLGALPVRHARGPRPARADRPRRRVRARAAGRARGPAARRRRAVSGRLDGARRGRVPRQSDLGLLQRGAGRRADPPCPRVDRCRPARADPHSRGRRGHGRHHGARARAAAALRGRDRRVLLHRRVASVPAARAGRVRGAGRVLAHRAVRRRAAARRAADAGGPLRHRDRDQRTACDAAGTRRAAQREGVPARGRRAAAQRDQREIAVRASDVRPARRLVAARGFVAARTGQPRARARHLAPAARRRRLRRDRVCGARRACARAAGRLRDERRRDPPARRRTFGPFEPARPSEPSGSSGPSGEFDPCGRGRRAGAGERRACRRRAGREPRRHGARACRRGDPSRAATVAEIAGSPDRRSHAVPRLRDRFDSRRALRRFAQAGARRAAQHGCPVRLSDRRAARGFHCGHLRRAARRARRIRRAGERRDRLRDTCRIDCIDCIDCINCINCIDCTDCTGGTGRAERTRRAGDARRGRFARRRRAARRTGGRAAGGHRGHRHGRAVPGRARRRRVPRAARARAGRRARRVGRHARESRPLRSRVLSHHARRGRRDAPVSAARAAGIVEGARGCRLQPGRARRRAGGRVRRRGAGRLPVDDVQRLVRRADRVARVVSPESARPGVRGQHRVFVGRRRDSSRLREPAPQRIGRRARVRHLRGDGAAHAGRAGAGRHAVRRRAVPQLRRGRRRHGVRRGNRRRRAQAARGRDRRRRSDPRHREGVRREPGRHQQRDHGAQRRRAGGTDRRCLRALRDRSGRHPLCRGPWHRHAVRRRGRGQRARQGVSPLHRAQRVLRARHREGDHRTYGGRGRRDRADPHPAVDARAPAAGHARPRPREPDDRSRRVGVLARPRQS
ncbi:polyketide synthase [Burkholderia pseudomallei]|nr:polyketide synthase [Burkholderia pseudomallei]